MKLRYRVARATPHKTLARATEAAEHASGARVTGSVHNDGAHKLVTLEWRALDDAALEAAARAFEEAHEAQTGERAARVK